MYHTSLHLISHTYEACPVTLHVLFQPLKWLATLILPLWGFPILLFTEYEFVMKILRRRGVKGGGLTAFEVKCRVPMPPGTVLKVPAVRSLYHCRRAGCQIRVDSRDWCSPESDSSDISVVESTLISRCWFNVGHTLCMSVFLICLRAQIIISDTTAQVNIHS